MKITSWQMTAVGEPMRQSEYDTPALADDEVLVRIAGCGVCHTDLGFFYDGVKTVKAPPITLGHEISGIVEECGASASMWKDKPVIIPAVMPCGECDLCRKGQGRICRKQKMPGNHMDGGFADRIVVPARHLCPVPVSSASQTFGNSGVTLRELAVVADAVTTPFQAVRNSGLTRGDVAIFIGIGGVGGYGVQIAHASGAHVVAIDIDAAKLDALRPYGIQLGLNPAELDAKAIRKAIQEHVKENGWNPFEWKIFETSGTSKGQELAYSLLTFGATLSVVGFTMDTLSVRLSNLMAYDARAIGNWGCLPELYPEVLQWVGDGRIQLAPFVELFPLSEINSVFEKSHHRQIKKRPILIPA